ncbi:hypothetical protein [Nocardioides donggukensis]|uniref:DUF222 domain-containing protein n=1 Tax=Nocardioides donggukensis TaxID=2774019 RepID=A0A927Q1F7_9ACTN|nr:hypothetical protein [Nocardioides donggukensis]MBD8868696.1 hypothetical protein [Nocardioides donggukensis]
MEQEMPDSAGETLTAIEGALRIKREAEAELLRLAGHWADLHGAVRPAYDERDRIGVPVRLGGEGTPEVLEFASAELAISLEVHPLAARSLMADVLDLRHRLPHLWSLTVDELRVPDWVARRVARLSRDLPEDVVAHLDARIAGETPDAATLPPSRLFTLVEAMVLAHRDAERDAEREAALADRFVSVSSHRARPGTTGVYGCVDDAGGQEIDHTLDRLAAALRAAGDTDPVDVRRAKALVALAEPARALRLLAGEATEAASADDTGSPSAAVLHLHVTDRALFGLDRGVARWEGVGPITRRHLVDLLRHRRVTVRPVHLPADERPRDSYEYVGDLREAVLLTVPRDCYPYAVGEARRSDVDHTIPYDETGPPGQTRLGNAGPLTRHHHRIKTAGAIRVRQPTPGTFVWATPHHRYRVTDRTGTRPVPRRIGEAIHSGHPMEVRLGTILLT